MLRDVRQPNVQASGLPGGRHDLHGDSGLHRRQAPNQPGEEEASLVRSGPGAEGHRQAAQGGAH